MSDDVAFIPVRRQRLSEELAERILASIAAGRLRPGDRLPPISEMARAFRVAPATVREALMRLEMQQRDRDPSRRGCLRRRDRGLTPALNSAARTSPALGARAA